jgi:hypothetical protein
VRGPTPDAREEVTGWAVLETVETVDAIAPLSDADAGFVTDGVGRATGPPAAPTGDESGPGSEPERATAAGGDGVRDGEIDVGGSGSKGGTREGVDEADGSEDGAGTDGGIGTVAPGGLGAATEGDGPDVATEGSSDPSVVEGETDRKEGGGCAGTGASATAPDATDETRLGTAAPVAIGAGWSGDGVAPGASAAEAACCMRKKRIRPPTKKRVNRQAHCPTVGQTTDSAFRLTVPPCT